MLLRPSIDRACFITNGSQNPLQSRFISSRRDVSRQSSKPPPPPPQKSANTRCTGKDFPKAPLESDAVSAADSGPAALLPSPGSPECNTRIARLPDRQMHLVADAIPHSFLTLRRSAHPCLR